MMGERAGFGQARHEIIDHGQDLDDFGAGFGAGQNQVATQNGAGGVGGGEAFVADGCVYARPADRGP